jgi:hypothetical protein
MSEVSTCCGCSFEDSTIADCCTVEMYADTDICPACNEHADASGFICNECGNWFEDPEDKLEYDARMEENYLEEKGDARRKYGE